MIKKSRYRALDGWRGICAILVATYHYPRTFEALKWPVFSSGWIFVDFFFVLSGFVITRRYLMTGPGLNFREFLAARVRRLYPTHAITAFAMACVSVAVAVVRYFIGGGIRFDGLGDSPSAFVALLGSHAFLLQGFGSFDKVGLNVPSWSISVEFYTNILFALVALTGNFNLGVLMLLALAATVLLAGCDPVLYLKGDLSTNLARAIQGFALGALAYNYVRSMPNPSIDRKWFSLAEAVCLVGLLMSTFLGRRLLFVWILPFLFAATVLVFAFERGLVSRLLLQGLFQLGGAYSYSIYLIHMIWVALFYIAETVVARVPPLEKAVESVGGAAVTGPGGFGLYLACVCISAAVMHKFVEKKFAKSSSLAGAGVRSRP